MKRKNPFLFIDRILAGKWYHQLLMALIPFALLLIIVIAIRSGSWGERFGKAFVDTTTTETIRKSLYDTNKSDSYNIGTEKAINKLERKKNNGEIFGFTIIYVLGVVSFTGLIISAITSIWRSRSEKFCRGAVSYNFKGHIVFIGYNNLVPGMIQKICEENEDTRIVVGVEDQASTISDKIKNRLWEKYRKNVVTLKADSCNREDLKRLQIPYAKEVYIIGEYDDAYNLKCYRTIYELSLYKSYSKCKMPQCYVNLQSQSTLKLFRTYASAGEIGVDFTNFHAFNFQDEWASTLLLKDSIRFNDINDCHNHIVIAGMTEMGIFIAQEAVLLCHYPNTHTTITFIDDAAEIRKKNFIAQHQNLFDHSDLLDVDFEFIEGNLTDEKVRLNLSNHADDLGKVVTIAICYDNPQQNISLGLNLPENIYGDKNNVRVWIYQPTSGDLGKYFKNSHYKNVVTFGMSGDLLDIRNKKNNQIAKRINHYFRRCNEDQIDYSNQRLIEMEWEELSIYDRWSYLRRATFIPVLLQNKNDVSMMIELERRRSVAEVLLFGYISTKNECYNGINYENYINNIYDIISEQYPDIPPSLNDPSPFYDFKLTDKCPSILKLYKH
ncbi:MAG: hypothetical protein J6T37_08125 [Bacteroidales bacterium]|nr:hypothetical protein [Bacteroidales bacterium]